jgi:putative phage-type endonuclease
MNDLDNILDKYRTIILNGNVETFLELESNISQDKIFKKLDEEEQMVAIDVLKESWKENNKKQEKQEKQIVQDIKEKSDNKNGYYYNKTPQQEIHTKKSNFVYEFGNRTKSGSSININNDIKSSSSDKKYSEFKFKTNSFENRGSIDPEDESEGALLSSTNKAIIVKNISEEEYIKRKNQFIILRKIESPEQRSAGWFAQRNKSITASDCGCVLGENHHEAPYKFIIKKVFGSDFKTNDACYHGKKFENVVTLMYELINDVIVDEFGLLGHPLYGFLAASPDGICTPYCRDNITPSPLVGRMIEIKCPARRKILYSGIIKGGICPDYYWCQVQLQLECCDLEECDFVQCNIQEYENRQDYLNDTNTKCDYKSQKCGLERGVVIELMPTKLEESEYYNYTVEKNTKDGIIYDKFFGITDDAIYDKASFLYQPKLDMSLKEVDEWIINQIDSLSSKPNVKLNRVIYWRFVERNCTLIKRNKVWFNKHLETMRKMWAYVEILRKNSNIAEKWKKWIDEQNKKYNDKVINKLIELIKNENLWNQVLDAISELDLVMLEEIKNMSIPEENITHISTQITESNTNLESNTNVESNTDNESNQEEIITKSSIKFINNQNKNYNTNEYNSIDLLESGKVSLVDTPQINTTNQINQTNQTSFSSNEEILNCGQNTVTNVILNETVVDNIDIGILSENFTNKIVIMEENFQNTKQIENQNFKLTKINTKKESKSKINVIETHLINPINSTDLTKIQDKEIKKRKSKKNTLDNEHDKINLIKINDESNKKISKKSSEQSSENLSKKSNKKSKKSSKKLTKKSTKKQKEKITNDTTKDSSKISNEKMNIINNNEFDKEKPRIFKSIIIDISDEDTSK